MRNIKTNVLVLLISGMIIIVSSCANSNQNSHSGMNSNMESESNGKQNKQMNNHDHGKGMPNHMDHMSDVRTLLQNELGNQYNTKIPASTDLEISAGKSVYVKVCQVCHGDLGKGDGPASPGLIPKPANFTDPEHSKFYSDMGRLYIIKKGIEGSAMAAWENALSETEINNVFAYVRSLGDVGNNSEHGEHDHSH